MREGDTLKRIAARFGTSVAAIKRLNDLGQPPRIRVGQLLVIPLPAG